MNSDTIALLIKFLPTILAAVLIVLCMLRGLMRGFRKSLILLLHYIISIAAGLVIYFNVSSLVFSDELNGILGSLSAEFAEANSMYDVIKILLQTYLPSVAGLANNQYIEQVVMAFAGLGISLALGIVCLVLIPWIIRFFLYLLYLLFYREGKIKNHKLAEGDDYKPHRLLGMAVGAVRGLVWSVVTITFITSFYFVLSGGITQAEEGEPESIDLLTSLSDDVGLDLNVIYRGLKESRKTGVGLLFDVVKINGKPVDLYYSDLFLSSKFKAYPRVEDEVAGMAAYISSDEAVQAKIAELSIRQELALIVGLLEGILESNAVNIVDGNVIFDRDALTSKVKVLIDEYVHGSVLLSEITPLAVLGLAEGVNNGDLVIDDTIKDIFSDNVLAEIRKLDITEDISDLISVALTAVELIPVKEGSNDFDFAALTDINTLMNLDTEKVKNIFEGLGNIKTLTKVVFPIGVGIGVQMMEETIKAAGIAPTDLDFSKIEWDKEISHIGLLYEKIVNLKLDVNELLSDEVNEESGVSKRLEYIIDLCTNEETSPEFKENLVALIDEIFVSDLFSQVGLVVIKTKIAEFNIVDENGDQTALGESLELVKENLKNYNVESLRLDLHDLTTSCLSVTSLLPVFLTGGEEVEDETFADKIFRILDGVETDDVKTALLGTKNKDGSYTGGIYDLRLFTGDFDEVIGTDVGCHYAIDSLIETTLKTFASAFISNETIDSITTVEGVKLNPNNPDYNFNAWPNELSSLIDSIASIKEVDGLRDIDFTNLGEDPMNILPDSIGNDDIDTITGAASKSIILSSFIENAIVSNLKDMEMIGDVVSDSSISWMDTFDSEDNVTRGELNSLLKAFIILKDEEKGIDLNNTDTLIDGLAQLIHPADENSLEENVDSNTGLDYEEVIILAKSQVIMTLISDKVSGLGSDEEGAMSIVVPDKLNSEVNDDAWKEWSHDDKNDHKKGEFAKLVLVLYYAREREEKLTEQVTLNSTEEETASPILTMDNLINAIIYMDKDEAIVDSLVLYATLSDKLISESGNTETSVMMIRDVAKWTKEEDIIANNGVIIKADEIDLALDVVRELEINLEGNNPGDINLQTVKDRIHDENVRRSICLSNIFNISSINKVVLTPSVQTHKKYNGVEDEKWYPKDEASWHECELNRLLIAIEELNIPVEENQFVFDDMDTLINDLSSGSITEDNKTKLDVVYKSDTIAATISHEVITNEQVEYREGILEEYDIVPVVEISKLLDFLSFANITFGEEIKLNTIITLLNNLEHTSDEEGAETYSEGTIRRISQSNILNKTVVSKVIGAPGLTIPSNLATADEIDWYPTNDASWANSQLAALLTSVVELNVGYDEKKNEFVIPDTTPLLRGLNERSKTGTENQTSLNIVYLSEIIKATIKTKIEDQKQTTENPSGTVLIRENHAYASDSYFKEYEIKLLCDFMALDKNINFDNGGIGTKLVFELLYNNNQVSSTSAETVSEATRRIIAESNILNKTVVDKLQDAKDITFPDKYQDLDAAEWYPSTKWSDCELSRLLVSVIEMNINYDNTTNEIKVPDTTPLLRGLNEQSKTGTENQTSLNVVYLSEIIKATIKTKIEEQKQTADNPSGTVLIRETYAYASDSYFKEYEIKLLCDFMALDNTIDLKAGIGVQLVFDLLYNDNQVSPTSAETVGEATRRIIAESNILNKTVVDKLQGLESLSMPIVYREDINYENWYPSSNGWADSELSRLLNGIVELEIEYVNNNVVIKGPNELLKSLDTEVGSNGHTKLDVVYDSEIIAFIISSKILEVKEVRARHTDEVEHSAYEIYDESENKEHRLWKHEIKLLVEFINRFDINVDDHGLDAEHILGSDEKQGLLENDEIYDVATGETKGEAARRMIVTSNILNKTLVHNVTGDDEHHENDLILFPSEYFNEDRKTINQEHAAWYPKTATNWEDSELNRLLISMIELDIHADGNKISFLPEALLDTLLDKNNDDETKLDIAYRSDIFAMTISHHITEEEGLLIPVLDNHTPDPLKPSSEYVIYDLAETRKFEDEIIHEDEAEKLLLALLTPVDEGGLGVSFEAGFDILGKSSEGGLSLNVLTNNISSEVSLLNSSILHYLISDNLLGQKQATSDNKDPGYSIITDTYYKSADEDTVAYYTNSHIEGEETYSCTYINKDEIVVTINSLTRIGINSINDVSKIETTQLITLFGTPDGYKNNKDLAENIANSAILSKIFGQILISEKIGSLSYYEAISLKAYERTDYYTTKKVFEYGTTNEVDILTQYDIADILANFSKLYSQN